MSTCIKRTLASVILTASVLVGGVTGCADDEADAATPATAVVSKAADLRVTLNLLLSEHLIVAAKATGAALDGRMADYMAYGTVLGQNSTDVGAIINQAFGPQAATQFNAIWAAHNGYVVDYVGGVAMMDEAKKATAVQNLTTIYVPQFSMLLSSATGLDLKAVTDLVTAHILTTKAVIDAQAAKTWPVAFMNTRAAFKHMQMLADPLAKAIAVKVPALYPGDASAKSVDLRVALNQLFQEHVYLATMTSNACTGDRKDEFMAAGAAVGMNAADVGTAVGSVYGPEAMTQFNTIWNAHDGYFVNYILGTATKNAAMQGQAVKDLTEVYIPQFSTFLSTATGLPQMALAGLITEHVLTAKSVVDAQGLKDFPTASNADRAAAKHMQMMADSLAKAIVEKFPTKF